MQCRTSIPQRTSRSLGLTESRGLRQTLCMAKRVANPEAYISFCGMLDGMLDGASVPPCVARPNLFSGD